jgi:hypothetical protein
VWRFSEAENHRFLKERAKLLLIFQTKDFWSEKCLSILKKNFSRLGRGALVQGKKKGLEAPADLQPYCVLD